MNALIIAFYGILLFLVGIGGKSGQLVNLLKQDAPGFLPWAISIGVLGVLNDIPQAKPVVGPFLFLLALAFVLRNFDTLRDQFNQLSAMANSAASKVTS